MAMDIGNAAMRAHGGVATGGMSALSSWGDLVSLRDVRAAAHSGALADLAVLGNSAGYVCSASAQLRSLPVLRCEMRCCVAVMCLMRW